MEDITGQSIKAAMQGAQIQHEKHVIYAHCF